MRRSNAPHITVIVPTRGRPDTLEQCLRTLISQDEDGLSILVSDNFSGDATESVVRGFSDPRIQYVNTGRRVSMAHNYEFALGNVKRRDGWVMLIGDDDGLMPGAVRLGHELVARSGVSAIRSAVTAYSWPTMTRQPYGRLGVPLGSHEEVRSSAEWLARVMRGNASYHELPMLYQGGLIRVAALDQIKAKSGSFYRSCIPDVYSAMAISSCVERYAFVQAPLAINGLSGHSIGMSQAHDRGQTVSPARQFRSEGNIPFHPDLPLTDDGDYPVGQPLVYEPWLQSAFLRPDQPGKMHMEQLVLTLATTPTERRDSTEAWARSFALLHGLDIEKAHRQSKLKRAALLLATGVAVADRALTTYAVGSSDLPLTDVFQASVAAGALRQAGLGRIQNFSRLVRRVVERAVSGRTSKP